MFRIVSLTLYGSQESQEFTYTFSNGINYFKGKNDSGKTEFYTFLDFMFGANLKLAEKDWYKGTLSHAKLVFSFNDREFVVERYLSNPNKNIFRYADEESADYIRLDDLKERLNSVFAVDEDALKEMRAFVEEDISYRTFTVFNFLGETRQGVLNDFFDKCSKINYAVKVPALLNYIFNRNISRIDKLKREEEKLKKQLEKLEKRSQQNNEIVARINHQLKILGLHIVFTGANADVVLHGIAELQNDLKKSESERKTLSIAALEAIYTSLDEQIKKQSAFEKDHRRFINEEHKQKELLAVLLQTVNGKSEYQYLVDPIIRLIGELDKSISFNRYLIQESSISELKKQRNTVRSQMIMSKSNYTIYSVSDKARAITLINEYISYYDADLDSGSISEIRSRLREIRNEIRTLQNADDADKITKLSRYITSLYAATKSVSELSEYDFSKTGFRITYIKNGNILQPQIEDGEIDESGHKNYYTGSLARHTLIQLCGYLGFLNMLISEMKFPLIPVLVIDHISKPFDHNNSKAIGAVIHEVYNTLNAEQLQIIMFDDEEPSDLGIVPNLNVNLIGDGKSGFNPFYLAPSPSVD